MPKFDELGTSGLQEYSGFIEEAFSAELRWPSCEPLYRRMVRSDPEITMIRLTFGSLARSQSIEWELPDDATPADEAAKEFAESVMDDITGGVGSFLEKIVSRVPFGGWGWWEVLPGLRNPKWRAPGGDPWQSEHNDNRIGIRRFAWRDWSSFNGWDMADNGTLRGMIQQDWPNPPVIIPLDRSLHLTFGDNDNPEGLALLEAMWRLERIKYGLEVVQGIGFEHAAGYLSVNVNDKLTPENQSLIKAAARAIMSAKEGNYAAWPMNITGELVDVPFGAAPAILEAIRYFGQLKLMVCNMQWMAMAGVSGAGSYAAMNDSSSMALMTYNAMMDGFASQLDAQIGRRLFKWNNFPGMTRRPRLTIPHVDKVISLGELASILGPISAVMPLGDDDLIAIRRRTGFLPETLPEITGQPEPEPEAEPDDEQQEDEQDEDTEPVDEETAKRAGEMAAQQRYWTRYLLDHPEAVKHE